MYAAGHISIFLKNPNKSITYKKSPLLDYL
jgi:hypothetical protein